MAFQAIYGNPAIPDVFFDCLEDFVSLFLLQQAGIYVNDLMKGSRDMKAQGKTAFQLTPVHFR